MKPEKIERWLGAKEYLMYHSAEDDTEIFESLARCREDIDAILTGDNRIVVLIRPDLLKRLMSDVAGLPKEGDDDYSQDLPPLDETVRGLPDVTDD